MRPQTTPFVVVAIDDTDHGRVTDEYRARMFMCQAEARGLPTKQVEGRWLDEPETSFVLTTETPEDVTKAHELAKQWYQQDICVVHRDGSAYQMNVTDGTTKYKGYWKKVQDWQVSRLLADGGPFTYDPSTNTYYVVGS